MPHPIGQKGQLVKRILNPKFGNPNSKAQIPMPLVEGIVEVLNVNPKEEKFVPKKNLLLGA